MLDKERLKTILAVVGTLIGLTGISLTVFNFVRDRPNVEVHVDTIGLPVIAAEDVRLQLKRIEATSGAVTGSLIADLLRTAEGIDDWRNVTAVTAFTHAIQDHIRRFDAGLSWTPEEIRIEGNTIIWPDTSSVDITQRSGAASFPQQLVNAMASGNVTESQKREIQQRAHKMHSGVSGEDARRLATRAAEGLRELRIKLEEAVSEEQRRLVARVTITNRSALPNYIIRSAAITIAKSTNAGATTIDLYVTEDGLLDRFSVRPITLESRALSALDEGHRQAILEALAKPEGHPCVVQLTDLHGKYWAGLGMIRSTPRRPSYDEFHRRGVTLLAEAGQ